MLKFSKAVVYIPDPVRSKANIPDEHLALAAQTPPMPLPLHCKPWMDEQTMGWTFFYGYFSPLTIIGLGEGKVRLENLEKLQNESKVPNIFQPFFGSNYFAITASGYTISTQENFVSYVLPPTHPADGVVTLPAIIETDWYPQELGAVYQMPAKGEKITFNYEDVLLRIVPVPRMDNLTLTQMTDGEIAEIMSRRAEYSQERESTEGKLTRSGGNMKRVYHRWSMRERQRRKGESDPPITPKKI